MWKVLCAFVLLLWGVCVPLFKRHIKQWPEGRMMPWMGSEWLFFALLRCHWLWSLFFIFSPFMENIIRQTSSHPCFRCLLEKRIIFWKEKCCFISKTKHELVWNYSLQFRWSKQLSTTLHVSTDSFSLPLGGKSEGPFMHRRSALEQRTCRFLSSTCSCFIYKDYTSWSGELTQLIKGNIASFNSLLFSVPQCALWWQ